MPFSHLLLSDPGVLQKHETNFGERGFQLFAQVVHLSVGDVSLAQAARGKVNHRDTHSSVQRHTQAENAFCCHVTLSSQWGKECAKLRKQFVSRHLWSQRAHVCV